MKKFVYLTMTGVLLLLTVLGIGAGLAIAEISPYDAMFVRFSGGTIPEIYRFDIPVTLEEYPYMKTHHYNVPYENDYPGSDRDLHDSLLLTGHAVAFGGNVLEPGHFIVTAMAKSNTDNNPNRAKTVNNIGAVYTMKVKELYTPSSPLPGGEIPIKVTASGYAKMTVPPGGSAFAYANLVVREFYDNEGHEWNANTYSGEAYDKFSTADDPDDPEIWITPARIGESNYVNVEVTLTASVEVSIYSATEGYAEAMVDPVFSLDQEAFDAVMGDDTFTLADYYAFEFSEGIDVLGNTNPVPTLYQVTDNAGAFDVVPQVTTDSQVYWQGWDGSDYEIYCYTTYTGDTIQLTDNDSPDVMPQANDAGHLVWMNWDDADWEVWYDLGEGPTQLTDNTGAFDVLPQITLNDLIYWQGWDGSDYEVYCYNSATGVTTQLTDNSLPDAALQVNPSGQITWMQYDGDWEVCYDIGSGPVQLTDNNGHDLVPQITPEGEIYWQGWDGGDYEICRFTIGSGLTENLTDNTVDDLSPAVNNGMLVWAQWDGSDWEIYRLVFDTGLTTRLTDDEQDDQRPRVNVFGLIVWHKWDGSDYEVYAYK